MANAGRLIKELMVEELSDALRQSPNVFVTSVGRLPAGETDTLRKQLRSVHARLRLVKRSLVLRSLSGEDHPEVSGLLGGSVALVFPHEDVLPTAKVIVEFARSHEDELVIRGGWVEGQLLDPHHVKELATLPSTPQLIAQLIGLIDYPMTDLIWTMERVLGEIAWVLEEASKSVEPVEPAAETPESTPASRSEPATPAAETPPANVGEANEEATPEEGGTTNA